MDRSSIGSPMGKNLTSPRKRMSIAQSLKRNCLNVSVSGRSNQSVQVICRTNSHVVENFGSSLPVLVTEALTFVDNNVAVSVNVSLDGWAWLVCGRRLLIWQCKTTIHDPRQRRTFKTQCRELLLTQSDLAHKAECIAVWVAPGQQVPSCMAVSPEGIVRYWASIAHEGSSVETSAELAGQEVASLTYVPGHGCILGTTTCTIALLQPQLVSGRNSISCRLLRTSQGWFGGIGRRMSSLIFGGMPQSPVQETKLVKVTCTGTGERGSRVFILAGSSLQFWSFPYGEQEKMVFEEDIGPMITQEFQTKILSNSYQNIQIYFTDMQHCDEGIVVIAAAQVVENLILNFAIGLIPLSGATLERSFKWFIPINLRTTYFNQSLDSYTFTPTEIKFILSGWEVIIYNRDEVLVVNTGSEHEQDDIDLMKGPEDSILGGALCSGTPVLFTRNHGLVTITPMDFSTQDSNMDGNTTYDYARSTSVVDEGFQTLMSHEEVKDMAYNPNGVMQLRAAFLFSVKQNVSQAEEILNELFPLQEEPVIDIDASLDTLALKVAKDLIDDYPANDPRWNNYRDMSMTISSVTAMQIPRQLKSKQEALDLFVDFLKEYSLWNRFSAVTYRGVVMSTTHVLGEYAEKIVAAMALCNFQNKYQELMNNVIEKTLQQDAFDSEELTPRDIFFREVSTIHQFLPTLVKTADDVAQSERPVQQVAKYIAQVNSILLGVLHEVVKYRQYNAERFIPSRCSNGTTEYLPWTAATGKHGLRNCLNTMQSITLKHTSTSDSVVRNELYEQLVSLIDLILDGRKCHLESIRGTEKFEILLKQYDTERSSLIQPLIKEEQFENAAMLAEKYCDFASLVQICELTNNKSRLDSYMEKFASQDFAGFLFSWYVKDGRHGQLVDRCRRGGANELTEKLSEHPSLAWVQSILTDDYRSASVTLYNLAKRESELVTRKKTQLSLAKLTTLVNENMHEETEVDLKDIDDNLVLIAHQEDLPADVLRNYGYDIDKLRVFTPAEIILMYTCDENTLASESDFRKALVLLGHVRDKEERESLRLKIWARAAKRDSWETVEQNPEQQVQSTLFYKLIELSRMAANYPGNSKKLLETDLPPLQESLLLEPELGTLAVSSNFVFLLKLLYEHVNNSNY